MAHELDHIHIIYVGALTGEQQFGYRLVRALHEIGCFEFTEDPSHADAMLEADGTDREEGFLGTLTLRDPRGTVLWSESAMRPHGTAGPMAYEHLVSRLKAALPSDSEHSRTA